MSTDLGEIFDLDRKQLTAKLVANIEQSLREIESAREDLKEIVRGAKEAQFRPREIRAMRKVAQLRVKDDLGKAREELEALQRIGQAVGFDLFAWAEQAESGPTT